MADLARYLRRFRRLVAPPGRPGPAAVPADRTAEASTELAELFAAIDRIAQQAAGISDDADDRARRRREAAEREAGRIIDDARRAADEARADAAARRRHQVDDEARGELAATDEEAQTIRERESERIDRPAERIVQRLLDAGRAADAEAAG